MSVKIFLYAPNVHTGGGFVLLRALLAAWPEGQSLRAILDDRARENLILPPRCEAIWTRPSLGSRWAAERKLATRVSLGDTVLCFHGLPPLLPSLGRVVVFQQNRNFLGHIPLSNFSMRTATRLAVERLISWQFRHRVDEYVVQTQSMARDLIRWYGNRGKPAVRTIPFMEALPEFPKESTIAPDWDFVYVADGETHKNHRCLLEAWRVLAQQGLRPKLALTLGARDGALEQFIAALRAECGAEVHNLGQMPHEQVIGLYRRTRALIFPSLGESFGLPLIEAQQLGVPIVASELDYVRDVCEPVQTFDPRSVQSIARAVKRFLQQPEPRLHLHSPAEFWGLLTEKTA